MLSRKKSSRESTNFKTPTPIETLYHYGSESLVQYLFVFDVPLKNHPNERKKKENMCTENAQVRLRANYMLSPTLFFPL